MQLFNQVWNDKEVVKLRNEIKNLNQDTAPWINEVQHIVAVVQEKLKEAGGNKGKIYSEDTKNTIQTMIKNDQGASSTNNQGSSSTTETSRASTGTHYSVRHNDTNR